MLLTDPDGRTVTIDKKKFNGTQRLHIKQQINRLRKNKNFNKAYKALKNDKNDHLITTRDAGETENTTQVSNESDASNGVGTGTTTHYDPEASVQLSGATLAPEVGLAHEFSHMEDAATGTRVLPGTRLENSIYDGVPLNEEKAVRFENSVRGTLGIGTRTTYPVGPNREERKVFAPNAEPYDPWP